MAGFPSAVAGWCASGRRPSAVRIAISARRDAAQVGSRPATLAQPRSSPKPTRPAVSAAASGSFHRRVLQRLNLRAVSLIALRIGGRQLRG